MGKQQVFLITVSIIVIGLAVYASLEIMKANAESSNREHLISTLYDIGLSAQKYNNRINEQTGHGNFIGWTIPSQFSKTESGIFVSKVNEDVVYLAGNGTQTGRNQTTPVRVNAKVTFNEIKITVIN
jgi:hypothetical protein